jgi:hypothetical protein
MVIMMVIIHSLHYLMQNEDKDCRNVLQNCVLDPAKNEKISINQHNQRNQHNQHNQIESLVFQYDINMFLEEMAFHNANTMHQ